MEMQYCRRGENLYLYFSGEMDERSVSSVRAVTDRLIEAEASATRAIFNLTGVKFMDSTGIGFLIGRYKKLQKYGIKMFLSDPNAGADKVLTLSGIYALIPKIEE